MTKPNFDVAALPGATLAAVLATFIPKGPFGFLSGIVGVTLIAILYAYEFPRLRTTAQSFALGCVIGLSSILVFGFIAEYWLNKGQGTGGAESDTDVPINTLLATWPIVVGIFMAADRLYWQKNLLNSDA